jgi:histidinol-phosphate/aromatic aminotransferase/cobyric acid decarboxylase-like protein
MPCPINKTPARQAIARLIMASLVIKASSTASRGGIIFYAAVEALKNPDYARKNIDRILQEKGRVRKSLDQLGVAVYDSSTNFLLVKAEVPDIARRLEEANVLVSDLSNQLPPGFIRISIGSKKENDTFIDRYNEISKAYELSI